MFIDARANYRASDDLECFESQEHKIYWRGLLYRSGVASGLDSVTKLAADLTNHTLQDLASGLRGSFLLVVHCKRSGDYYVLVDNSGLFHVHYSESAISTSFLDLAAFHGFGTSDLDPEAVVEFLHYGLVSFDRTLFRNIHKLPPEQIAHISSSSGITFLPKSLPSLGSPPIESLEDLLRDFASCVSAERVSVDLTGGMDTRFLVLLLHYLGLDFEVAVRGNDTDVDVQIATEVAAVLGKRLHICHSRIDGLESDLLDTLDICDGLFDVVKSYGALQLQRERVQRGITLMLSAAGGELYRDHFWLQDFPFYSQKKAHLERFCNFRLLPTDPDHLYLEGSYREVSCGYRRRFLHDLSEYEVAGNTQTYDRIIYRVRYREMIGRFVTNHTHVLRCYPPLMERDAVIYGYQLSRFSRFFDYYFRKTATKCLPQAARIRTTRGYVTLSSELPALAGDAYKYCNDKLIRVKRRLEQKYFDGRHRSCGNLDEPLERSEQFSTLRRSKIMKLAVARLVDCSILNPAIRVEDMKENYLGTVLTLAMVMDRLDSIGQRNVTEMPKTVSGASTSYGGCAVH